jgi:hypothetical protein
MSKKMKTKSPPNTQWPAGWAADEGWPDESTPFPGRPGQTYGDIATALGTTVEAMCVRLGKPAKSSKGGA